MSSDEPAVEVVSAAKAFRRRRRLRAFLTPWKSPGEVQALTDVSLTVRRGELVALLGPNGAGKSTLLKVLAALVVPSSGAVRVFGEDVVAKPRLARRRVGYVFTEERSFYWRLSCRDNLRFFASLHGLSGRLAQDRIEHLAGLLGLREQLERDFMDLSTGQRQRVAIARGLLADPEVILFDEATRSLDPGRARRLRRIVRTVLVERQKKAVIFATHDLEEAKFLADRVVLMKQGRVLGDSSYQSLEAEIERTFEEESADEERELEAILSREVERT